jgi:hypothetical protein
MGGYMLKPLTSGYVGFKLDKTQKARLGGRVTRLGEVLSLGRLLTFGRFF